MTYKLLTKEQLAEIRARYVQTIIPKHSTPFGGSDADKGILEVKDFEALLTHIEAQEKAIEGLVESLENVREDLFAMLCNYKLDDPGLTEVVEEAAEIARAAVAKVEMKEKDDG